jgi:hypothetical protein
MKNLRWLVALLVASAIGWRWFSAPLPPFLELSLRPDRTMEQRCVLKVARVRDGLHYEFSQNNRKVEEGQLSPSESSKLLACLREDRAWELTDEDTGEPEADVWLYAEFTIEGHHSTCRGLTRGHTPVIQELINDPHLNRGLNRALDWCAASKRVNGGKRRAALNAAKP